MGNSLLTGIWRTMVRVPPFLWEKQIEKARRRAKKSTCFMSLDHQRVHHYAVRELPRFGRPIPAEMVARELAMSDEHAVDILSDLEKHMTFLCRNEQGQGIEYGELISPPDRLPI